MEFLTTVSRQSVWSDALFTPKVLIFTPSLIAQCLRESAKIYTCISTRVDKMKKFTEFLNITKRWRKGRLRARLPTDGRLATQKDADR